MLHAWGELCLLEELMPNKTLLRAKFHAIRDGLSQAAVESASDHIRDHVLALSSVRSSKSLFVYCSFGSEVQTYNLIEDLLALGKTVAVPRITDAANGIMDAVPIHSLKDLTPGPFGVLAPQCGAALAASPDLALVPGLAFSPVTGHRLGYGKGFFDRYLRSHPETMALGLAFEQQLVDSLPADEHDQPLDSLVLPASGYVLTQTGQTH